MLYYQSNNKSFTKESVELQGQGVRNTNFLLVLKNHDLVNVDPYNKHLSMDIKAQIIRECSSNFMYFVRTICKDDTISINSKLLFALYNNLNIILDDNKDNRFLILRRYIWTFLFSRNNTISLLDKSIGNSRNTLKDIREISSDLPSYLFSNFLIKDNNNLECMKNSISRCEIKTIPTEFKDKEKSVIVGRSLASSCVWFNNFGSINNANELYQSAMPTIYQSREFSKSNNSQYGIILSNISRKNNHELYEQSIPFDKLMYDMTEDQLEKYIKENSLNGFVIL